MWDTEYRAEESAFIGPIPGGWCGVIPLTIANSKDPAYPFMQAAQGSIYIYLPTTGTDRDYTKNAQMYIKATWVNPTDPAKSDWWLVSLVALTA